MTILAEVTARVVLPVPGEEAWAAVVDWPAQDQWMLMTQVRGGQGLGATVTARTGIGPVGFTDSMVITQWDPPRRCTVRHTGRLVRGSGVFDVTAAGSVSELRWTEQLQLPAGVVGRLGWPLIRPLARRGMELSLRRLARTFAPAEPR